MFSILYKYGTDGLTINLKNWDNNKLEIYLIQISYFISISKFDFSNIFK